VFAGFSLEVLVICVDYRVVLPVGDDPHVLRTHGPLGHEEALHRDRSPLSQVLPIGPTAAAAAVSLGRQLLALPLLGLQKLRSFLQLPSGRIAQVYERGLAPAEAGRSVRRDAIDRGGRTPRRGRDGRVDARRPLGGDARTSRPSCKPDSRRGATAANALGARPTRTRTRNRAASGLTRTGSYAPAKHLRPNGPSSSVRRVCEGVRVRCGEPSHRVPDLHRGCVTVGRACPEFLHVAVLTHPPRTPARRAPRSLPRRSGGACG
jgi:hypothetical protein